MNILRSIANRGGCALAVDVMQDTGAEHEALYEELVSLEAVGMLTLDSRTWVMDPLLVDAVRRMT